MVEVNRTVAHYAEGHNWAEGPDSTGQAPIHSSAITEVEM
jgi:hypothetical protein